jgi:hypothetical protein
MSRLRRWSVATLVFAAGLTLAADPPTAKPGGEKWQLDRELTVTPRGEPSPALKYRLLPLAPDLKEGNAVPIYLRLRHEQRDAARKHWSETPLALNDLPLDKLPLDKAHEFLDRYSRFLTQLDYGARRKNADWNYTLEQPDPISILLPDTQEMRSYLPMLVLRARVRIAEKNYPAAAEAIETGYAFGRHVSNGPFLISGLVGIAINYSITHCVDDWICQPDAPNLYWSLDALPRPLIGLRSQMEFEQRVFDMQFPEMTTLDRPRSAAEWDAVLKRFRTEVKRIFSFGAEGPNTTARRTTLTDPDEPAAKSPELGDARNYVMSRLGKSAAEVASMPPAQVLLLYFAGMYGDLRDQFFKLAYLPFPDAHRLWPGVEKRLNEAKGGEAARLAQELLPTLDKALVAEARLERRLALLQAVEALRLYAADHDARLPDSLDDLKDAPAPLDPGTGKQFDYHREGATATLTSRLPGEPVELTGLRYRVTIASHR